MMYILKNASSRQPQEDWQIILETPLQVCPHILATLHGLKYVLGVGMALSSGSS